MHWSRNRPSVIVDDWRKRISEKNKLVFAEGWICVDKRIKMVHFGIMEVLDYGNIKWEFVFVKSYQRVYINCIHFVNCSSVKRVENILYLDRAIASGRAFIQHQSDSGVFHPAVQIINNCGDRSEWSPDWIHAADLGMTMSRTSSASTLQGWQSFPIVHMWMLTVWAENVHHSFLLADI